MQTFLPYESFADSAAALDKRRAWKQVLECKQILCILNAPGLPDDWQASKSFENRPFKNHPAVLMWSESTESLKMYFNVFLSESRARGVNTSLEPLPVGSSHDSPWWLGHEDFHRAMRARLHAKDPEGYADFSEDATFNGGKYLWPVMSSRTFRSI